MYIVFLVLWETAMLKKSIANCSPESLGVLGDWGGSRSCTPNGTHTLLWASWSGSPKVGVALVTHSGGEGGASPGGKRNFATARKEEFMGKFECDRRTRIGWLFLSS